MNPTEAITEGLSVLNITTVSAASTVTTDWILASYCNITALAAIGAGGNTDLKIIQAKDDTGTDSKDLPNAAITTLPGAGNVAVNVKPIDLDINNQYTHIAVEITTDATQQVTNFLLGVFGEGKPVDTSLLTEIVNAI